MSIPTKRIIQTRDAIWLQQTYGEYSGDKRIKDHASPIDSELLAQLQDAEESTSDPPSKVSKEIVILPADTNELMGSPTATPATPSRLSNRVKKPVQILTSNRKGELTDKTLELATAKDFTQAPLVERVHHNNKQLSNPGREAATFSSLPAGIAHPTIEDAAVWVDKFGESAEILSDTAMAATDVDYSKVDPSTYKDIFTVPTTFEEAWNHPCPFQRERWRAGILKEMKKMEENKVWKKIKRSEMPKDRRCIKHKWVFEIKRSGVFRCRLVGAGYSQIPGVDFQDVYQAVADDETFRIMLILRMLKGYDFLIFDVETAFLHGQLDTQIYMDCPKGMEAEPDECLLLVKTIYGLVQSSRLYYLHYKSVMVDKLGFEVCPCDPCLFKRTNELGSHLLC
jgi:hypothetical protein